MTKPCKLVQMSDSMVCQTCHACWDMNDPDGYVCPDDIPDHDDIVFDYVCASILSVVFVTAIAVMLNEVLRP